MILLQLLTHERNEPGGRGRVRITGTLVELREVQNAGLRRVLQQLEVAKVLEHFSERRRGQLTDVEAVGESQPNQFSMLGLGGRLRLAVLRRVQVVAADIEPIQHDLVEKSGTEAMLEIDRSVFQVCWLGKSRLLLCGLVLLQLVSTLVLLLFGAFVREDFVDLLELEDFSKGAACHDGVPSRLMVMRGSIHAMVVDEPAVEVEGKLHDVLELAVVAALLVDVAEDRLVKV